MHGTKQLVIGKVNNKKMKIQKRYWFIIFSVITFVVGMEVLQYGRTLRGDIVAAVQTIPNPGHSWAEMESDPDSIQVSGRTITNLTAPINSTDATNKEYVDAASGSACPANYGNLCSNGGGLAFTYGGKTIYIDAFPRSSAWYTSGSPTGQSLAWQMCGAIGARLPTLEEWQAACTALSGPSGNGTTTFGGGKSDRWEWTATPSSSNYHFAVVTGGGTCTGSNANHVNGSDGGIGSYGFWFRCVR